MKRKSVRGGTITFVSQGTNAVIHLASTVVLARMLGPGDYGVVAMVTAVTAFAGMFRDLGLSTAAIQKHALTHAQQSNLFWLNVGSGSLLTVVVAYAAPLVAWFYQRPELTSVTVVLSMAFAVGSLATQSSALLLRNMRFGRHAIATICGAVFGFVVSVLLAVNEAGYWALVWGQLTGSLTATIVLLLLSPFRPGWPTRGTGLRTMAQFGAHVTAFNVVNYFQRNLDNVLIGRVHDVAALGLYSRAYSLLMFPISNIRGPINAVAFPAMSRLQHDPIHFREYYKRATFLLALLSMPLSSFLLVASKPVIEIVLGREWLDVVPIFSWLAMAAFIQPASGLAGSVLLSLGHGRRYLQCGAANATFLGVSFVVGLPWGPEGVALAYAIANYIVLYPWMSWAFRGTPVSFWDFVHACWLPCLASLASSTAVWLLAAHLSGMPAVAQVAVILMVFLFFVAAALGLTVRGQREMAFLLTLVSHLRRSSRG